MHKKHPWPALPALVLIALNLLAGCNEEPSSAPPAPGRALPKPAVTPDTVPRAVVTEIEKRATVERELRATAETRRDREETAKAHWQNIALLMSTGAVVLLLVGTVLGSRARHESES